MKIGLNTKPIQGILKSNQTLKKRLGNTKKADTKDKKRKTQPEAGGGVMVWTDPFQNSSGVDTAVSS